jgi:hypothetical protein
VAASYRQIAPKRLADLLRIQGRVQ